ncbi:MAG: type IX secretion system sortase PorU [bacterium]
MKCRLSIMIFLFLYLSVSFAQDIKILSSSASSIVFEYKPILTDSSEILIDSQLYKKIFLFNGFYESSMLPGRPAIPVREINIGVPSETGNTVQILSADSYLISGKLLPVPELQKNEKGYSTNYKINDNYNELAATDLVGFGEFGLVRDLQVQSIVIRPVQFDPASQKITIYKKVVFQINYGRNSGSYFEINEDYLSDVVLNYHVAKSWGLHSVKNELRKINAASVLSTGTWYKFPVTEEGIYKIDRSKLSSFGIDAASVDPRTIKIFNNGGYVLSEDITDAVTSDLVENAIFISGEEDGRFDEGDYILFYGRGINFWEHNPATQQVERQMHLYSNENYYFITSGGSVGKRMSTQNSLNESSFVEQTSTKSYVSFEENKFNKEEGGRIYVGNEFSASDQTETYLTSLPHLISGEIKYQISFLNYSSSVLQLKVDESGTNLINTNLTGINGIYSSGRLHKLNAVYNGTITDNRSILRFEFTCGESNFGYLNYFEIIYPRALMAADDILYVYANNVSNLAQYTFSNFNNSDIYVFDITNYSDVQKVSPLSLSGGQFKFQAYEAQGSPSKYLGICSTKFLTPSNGTQIENSNLHGIAPGTEYIIITHKNFGTEAQTLKTYRTSESDFKFSTELVYIDEIFNEFSGGLVDPTAIRNFLKFAFTNWQTKPFYVLLFGDGTYDVLNAEGYNNNFIPTYQSVESFNWVFAYPTDDYYARISGSDKKVDVAISRLNINTVEDAQIAIDKIKYYENESDKGLWRNLITLIADDGLTSTGNDGSLHTDQSEDLATFYIPDYIDKNKIYLSAYPTVNTALGRRKPSVNEAVINAVNAGTLTLNYTGHGNPDIWAHEVIFDRNVNIAQFKNKDYFFLTAATCDFGKYDDTNLQSGTEEMLLLEDRGMIGGLSADRPVISNDNAALNNIFYENLFGNRDSQNLPVPIGKAYFNLKQIRTNTNDEKFHLFCEPVLRLNQPRVEASIDSLNGGGFNGDIQIRALSNVNIKGTVRNSDGGINTGFNGEAIISVFDSERKVNLSDINYSMKVQGGLIFRGRASVENGIFNVSFTVPKDISYENKNGKILAYILNDETDGLGFTNQILVGGSDSSVVNDNKGPEIEIYYDEISTQSSYLVNPDFTLFVKLEDGTGLNTTGTGVGHKLEGILNNDEENPIDFTEYFIGDMDAGGKSGKIEYKFVDMEPGDYNIKIKAWDVFNNGGIDENNFTVVNSGELTVRDVYNYPNPFSDFTVFTFQHNLTSMIDIKIKVYTVAGRLIKEIEENNVNDKFVKIYWDGRDADGSVIANGTYLYKLNIKTIDGQYNQNVLGKLAVIR